LIKCLVDGRIIAKKRYDRVMTMNGVLPVVLDEQATAALISAAEDLLNAAGTNAALCGRLRHPEQV
jgi:hypothetical protein